MHTEQVYPGLKIVVTSSDGTGAIKRKGKIMSPLTGQTEKWWVQYEDDGNIRTVHIDNMSLAEITEIEIIL
jgi:hypothetical protein